MRSEVQPFRVTVFDSAFGRLGWVGNPTSLSVSPRWNGVGTASLTVSADHPRVRDLLAPGARTVIEMDVAWDAEDPGDTGDWRHVLSGPVTGLTGSGPKLSSILTFNVSDDWRLLRQILGWQVPGSPIASQSGAEYRTVTGPAETVVKTLVAENAVARLGMPVTVAPDLGRGATITVSTRMHRLADRLFPAVDQAGIGVTVRQWGAGLLVDVVEGDTHPRVLTEESGAVQAWALATSSPDATRAVVGGSGEGTARVFRQVTDSAREAEWGDVVEVFRDATDTADPAVLDARGLETLTEGAPTSGLSVTLADTPTLRLLRDVNVGDVVTLDVGGVPVTDVLREALLSWSAGDGVRTEPKIGGWDRSPQAQLVHAVGAIGRAVGSLGRR